MSRNTVKTAFLLTLIAALFVGIGAAMVVDLMPVHDDEVSAPAP